MSKNIVICCDGTGNEFGDRNSNVVKLYSTLVINQTQVGYYHPGVGTMGSPTARTALEKQWTRLKDLAFGASLLSNVADAYRYLMDTYEEGDKVYLFGFSRGAYTVRALAGVLHMYGLLCPGNDGLIPYVTRMFAKRSRRERGMKATFDVADNFKYTFSRNCPLHFVGVWDTVSSVGWIYDPVVLPYSARNSSMRIGRHAVSIDERRCFFRQNLWGAPFEGQDIRQVWFSGVHSDVGGSYPEKESGLSKITLEWMLVEAAAAGLEVDPYRANIVLGRIPRPERWMPDYVKPDPAGHMHQSLEGPWWLLELLPHRDVDMTNGSPVVRYRIPLGRYRLIPEGSVIHESALEPVNKIGSDRLPKHYTTEPASRLPALLQSASVPEASDLLVDPPPPPRWPRGGR
jgi:Uncharacterized alpha/beta hydrolase domain (DUF2235)